jgi:5'-3' exonuclease
MEYEDEYTGIIFKFFVDIMFLYKKYDDPSFSFAWDSAKSERIRYFPKYKWNRRHKEKKPDQIILMDNCYPQFNLLRKEILPQIGWINNFHQVGYEGDDILASIILNNVFEVKPIMVSGDEDMFQLLDKCSIYIPSKKLLMTKNKFFEEYNLQPKDWVKVKQIGGCRTDEVPGVKNVGEGRAVAYLTGKMKKQSKFYQDIQDNQELIEFNHQLVNLPYPGTRPITLKTQRLDINKLNEVFERYGFKSLLKKFGEWERFFKDANKQEIDDIPL